MKKQDLKTPPRKALPEEAIAISSLPVSDGIEYNYKFVADTNLGTMSVNTLDLLVMNLQKDLIQEFINSPLGYPQREAHQGFLNSLLENEGILKNIGLKKENLSVLPKGQTKILEDLDPLLDPDFTQILEMKNYYPHILLDENNPNFTSSTSDNGGWAYWQFYYEDSENPQKITKVRIPDLEGRFARQYGASNSSDSNFLGRKYQDEIQDIYGKFTSAKDESNRSMIRDASYPFYLGGDGPNNANIDGSASGSGSRKSQYVIFNSSYAVRAEDETRPLFYNTDFPLKLFWNTYITTRIYEEKYFLEKDTLWNKIKRSIYQD